MWRLCSQRLPVEQEDGQLAEPGAFSPNTGQIILRCESNSRNYKSFDRILCNFNIRMMPGYRVGRRGRREADIRQEIRTQGPVQATMDVYQVLSYNI